MIWIMCGTGLSVMVHSADTDQTVPVGQADPGMHYFPNYS